MIRHPKGENTISSLLHSPLMIPRVPVTFARIECRRGLQKIPPICKVPMQDLLKKIFLLMHQMTDFDGERFMI